MLDVLSAKQLSEWEAFNRIQPIGQRRFDIYFSEMMATIHNAVIGFSGTKNPKWCKPEDFLPNWTGIKEESNIQEMSVQQMKNVLVAFAEQHNKTVSKQVDRDHRPPKNLENKTTKNSEK